MTQSGHLAGYGVGTPAGRVMLGLVGLILIAADATERDYRKW
jgi:hypothetical protein